MIEETWSASGAGIAVNWRAPETLAMLRLRGFDAAVLDAVSEVIGVALPVRPNMASGRSPRVLCLAPNEWMIAGFAGEADTVLEAASGADVAHLAQVGEGVVTYEVAGPAARNLLAKGCTLDFHPRVFGSGQCAQSLLAQVGVVIDRAPDGEDFVVYASASYAHHLESWFADAIIEFRQEASA